MSITKLRELNKGFWAVVILTILIAPFLFFGVSSYFISNDQNVLALVNDEEITLNDFNQRMAEYRQRWVAQFGTTGTERFDELVFKRQFLDSMIDSELMSQAGNSAHLTVADNILLEQLRSTPAFQLEGQFNREIYENQLAANGLTKAQYENQMRQQLLDMQIPQLIANSSIATGQEIAALQKLENQQRSFAYVKFPRERFSSAIEISEADLQAYYDSHLTDYLSDEQVVIEYIELNIEDLLNQVEITEEDLQQAYRDAEARLIKPEERLASHILITLDENADEVAVETARQTANELSKQAQDGADFAALAQEHSQDVGSAERGGDLGWVTPNVMVPAFEDALYALIQGDVSEPVRTRYGFHVIQLRDIKPASGMSFDEARTSLETELRRELAQERLIELSDGLIDEAYDDPTSLQPAAQALEVEIRTLGPFSRAGGAELASDPAILEAAFSDLVLADGNNSELITLSEDHVLVLRVKERIAAAQQPFAEVQDAVREALVRERSSEQAKQAAEQLLGLSAEEVQAAIADSESEWVSVAGASRRDYQHGADLINEVFELNKPSATDLTEAVVELTDGYALVLLESVADGATDAVTAEQIKRRLASQAAVAERSGITDFLRAKAEINVFEDRLQ